MAKSADTPDEEFYDLADAHIELSNAQLDEARPGRVSAAMLYAAARFNVWLSARGFDTAAQMEEARAETIAYYMISFEKALSDHFDDYAGNFDDYMTPDSSDA